jgi:hypothetical protein
LRHINVCWSKLPQILAWCFGAGPMLALIIIIAIGVFVGVLMAKNSANAFMVVFGSAFVVMMLYLISERVLP